MSPTLHSALSLQEESLPSAEVALILHRKGFDCGLEAKNLGFNCSTSQGKVSEGPGVGKAAPWGAGTPPHPLGPQV